MSRNLRIKSKLMAIFITGSTGHLGSRLVYDLVTNYDERLILLIRARKEHEAKEKLWASLQLYLSFEQFIGYLQAEKIQIVLGDITKSKLGISAESKEMIMETVDSIIHCAAILNRKSLVKCEEINVEGTRRLTNLAKEINSHRNLKKFSFVSTVTVSGERKNEFLAEEEMIDSSVNDPDPYCSTKRHAESIVQSLKENMPINIFRPSAIIGDSITQETIQFTMLKPLCILGRMPVLPISAKWKLDIVPVDFVSQAISRVHLSDNNRFTEYNLSAGNNSLEYSEITKILKPERMPQPVFISFLFMPVYALLRIASKTPRFLGISKSALLMKVFMPFIGSNTTYNNSRVVEEFGIEPASFKSYGKELTKYSKQRNFNFIHKPMPIES